MATVSATLRIDLAARVDAEVFELVAAEDDPDTTTVDESGSEPVDVVYYHLGGNPLTTGYFDRADGSATLDMTSLGQRTVKLFCPEERASQATFRVDNGETTVSLWDYYLYGDDHPGGYDNAIKANYVVDNGRRTETVTEFITFDGDTSQRIKYYHDAPEVAILTQSDFTDAQGTILPDPVYVQSRGEFTCGQESYGYLEVEYEASYTELIVYYTNGKEVCSDGKWADLQEAWSDHDLTNADPPDVRLVAFLDNRVATVTFERKFFPNGETYVSWSYGTGEEEQEDVTYTEYSSEKTTKKVYDSSGSGSYLEVEAYKKVLAKDLTTGRTMTLEFLV